MLWDEAADWTGSPRWEPALGAYARMKLGRRSLGYGVGVGGQVVAKEDNNSDIVYIR